MRDYPPREPDRPINPGHESHRAVLKGLGGVLVTVGGILLTIGLVDFFSAFGGMRPPKLFWCAFLGLPMTGIGGQLLMVAFGGRIARYMSQETAPVAKDTFNYVADGTREGVQAMASAVVQGVRQGIEGGGAANAGVICRACGRTQDADSRFCDQCGAAVAGATCGGCGCRNDADSRFCKQCGERLA